MFTKGLLEGGTWKEIPVGACRVERPQAPRRTFFENGGFMELTDPQQSVLIAFAIGFVLGMVTMKT
jgi:hypothetical protein